MEKIEFLILRNLLYNEEYTRKVLPFIKAEYFEDSNQKIIFEEIYSFITEYNKLATKEVLYIELGKRNDLNEETFKETSKIVSCLDDVPVEKDWVVDTTEKWCRDRAIYLALVESIHIADGDDKKNRDSIPSILSDALAVSFDNHVGHDYLQDYEERYESYHRKEEKIEFDLEYFNKITKGGLPNKTLNIALAGTGVGKSLFMCHVASSVLLQGKNVLYITLEMAEERIAERIDANLLNVPIQDIIELPKNIFETKVNNIAKKTQGTLIIKEYPTASAHSGHFKGLITELALKKSFKPDIIFIDYLNICASSRFKGGSNINSYTLVKSIAEELRGLAVEFNVPIMSATQTTRSGFCLDLKTQVQTQQGLKDISNIQVGDFVLSNTGYNEVLNIFSKTKKKSYKITLEDGKEIICSEEHLFPTENGEMNIKGGLEGGMCLYVKELGKGKRCYLDE
jgi:replicative DNA helicase